MKGFIGLVAALCAVPAIASAQSAGQVGYVEGSIGMALISNVDSKPFTATGGGSTFIGRGEIDYGNEFIGGVELGTGGLADGDLRLGISYDYMNAQTNSVKLLGTLNGAPINANFSRADLTSLGVGEIDSNIHLVSANVYYNLPLIGPAIRPYLGIGVGAAMIEHLSTELQFNGSIGFRYAISEGAYVGGRYRFIWITGPKANDGIQYDQVTFHAISFVLGFYLP